MQGACSLSLLQWYATRHATSASVDQWRAAILAGQMEVNGQLCRDPDARLPANAVVVHRRPGWAEPEAPAFLDVLWWDAHIVAVHKPSGLQVGGRWGRKGTAPGLRPWGRPAHRWRRCCCSRRGRSTGAHLSPLAASSGGRRQQSAARCAAQPAP